jgi:16S rRNA (guanine527-N7)-methyltransferase
MALAAPLTAEGFARETGVSRETLARLERHAALLRHWEKSINLVSSASLADLWRRHMLDSAQLADLLPPGARVLLDVGSGAGFPGLVLAIMGFPEVHLVEADGRKASFLAEALRAAALAPSTRVFLHRCRVEALAPFSVDVITARACAPLSKLLELIAPFLGVTTNCLLLKGERVEAELTAAAKGWKMKIERIPSRSDPRGVVLRIAHVCRR